MPLSRQDAAQQLLRAYQAYFDITPIDDGTPLIARCVYHERSEKYVLTQKAKLWGAETNEYLYVFSLPELTMECYEQCRERAMQLGMELVHPHSEHMYSYITAVILCDTARPEALDALRHYKKTINFKLSLHGWMEYHIAAVELTTAGVTANRSGKELKKQLLRVMKLEPKHI